MRPVGQRGRLREALFRISVSFKGLDGVLEIFGGAALFILRPPTIVMLVGLLTQDEIAEDPGDLVANLARRAAGDLRIGGEHFVATYLLVHGLIKVGLVWALLTRRMHAYPLAMVVFTGFVAYQLYRFTLTHALGLIAFSVVDLVMIVLIYLEYRAAHR